jgi:hypothetical protein
MAQITAADSAQPSITQVKAYDRPMHHGSICLAGLDCITQKGNRNLADFFEITADAQGAAYIVFDNTANDLIEQVPVVQEPLPEGTADHSGAEVVEVVRQIGGTGLNGTPIDSPTDVGVNSISAGAGDARYEPIAGPNFPGLDVRGVSLVTKGDKLEATIQVTDPSAVAAAAQAIGAPFVDFVVRWEDDSKLYFASAEYTAAGGTPTFSDGESQSIDLCSVSACDPHILSYPGPHMAPSTSHATTGTVSNGDAAGNTPGSITIDVPRADVGGPKDGDRVDSVGGYSLVSLLSFDAPLTNAMAENDLVPVEVDGACCFTPFLNAGGAQGAGSSTPTATSSPTSNAVATLPNTSAPTGERGGAVAAAVGVVVALGLLAMRRRRVGVRVRR